MNQRDNEHEEKHDNGPPQKKKTPIKSYKNNTQNWNNLAIETLILRLLYIYYRDEERIFWAKQCQTLNYITSYTLLSLSLVNYPTSLTFFSLTSRKSPAEHHCCPRLPRLGRRSWFRRDSPWRLRRRRRRGSIGSMGGSGFAQNSQRIIDNMVE